MTYTKKIKVTDTGMVVAEVFCGDRRVGLEFFSPFITTTKSVERCGNKAHKWADEYIKACESVEVGYD